MPATRPDDDPLGRALGIAPDPRDAIAAEEARAIGAALHGVPVPPAALPGWQSLCATEYAESVRALSAAIRSAAEALAVTSTALR